MTLSFFLHLLDFNAIGVALHRRRRAAFFNCVYTRRNLFNSPQKSGPSLENATQYPKCIHLSSSHHIVTCEALAQANITPSASSIQPLDSHSISCPVYLSSSNNFTTVYGVFKLHKVAVFCVCVRVLPDTLNMC